MCVFVETVDNELIVLLFYDWYFPFLKTDFFRFFTKKTEFYCISFDVS